MVISKSCQVNYLSVKKHWTTYDIKQLFKLFLWEFQMILLGDKLESPGLDFRKTWAPYIEINVFQIWSCLLCLFGPTINDTVCMLRYRFWWRRPLPMTLEIIQTWLTRRSKRCLWGDHMWRKGPRKDWSKRGKGFVFSIFLIPLFDWGHKLGRGIQQGYKWCMVVTGAS